MKDKFMTLPAACRYLGVSRPVFCRNFRPHLSEMKPGPRTILFEKGEIDRLMEHLKNGGIESWQKAKVGYKRGVGIGTRTRVTSEWQFADQPDVPATEKLLSGSMERSAKFTTKKSTASSPKVVRLGKKLSMHTSLKK